MRRGWLRVRKADAVQLFPVADGGDGFGAAMADLLGARAQRIRTMNAAHQPWQARWWWQPGTRTAIIDSAGVIGLAVLPPGRFHPHQLDTYGLGTLLKEARERGARACLLGVGGSATNDGGFGLARALGWRFLDTQENEIERWTDLAHLRAIRPPATKWRFPRIVVAVDVANPLCGPRGATRVYGPQKGLKALELKSADRCLSRLAKVYREQFGTALAEVPGAGAAGGLGFGLMAFTGASLQSGFELFSRQAGLAQRLRWADLVLTGEGALDRSSFMGKGVGEIAQACHRRRLPCIAIAGSIAPVETPHSMFQQSIALTSLTDSKTARSRAAFWLQKAAESAALACQLP